MPNIQKITEKLKGWLIIEGTIHCYKCTLTELPFRGLVEAFTEKEVRTSINKGYINVDCTTCSAVVDLRM